MGILPRPTRTLCAGGSVWVTTLDVCLRACAGVVEGVGTSLLSLVREDKGRPLLENCI